MISCPQKKQQGDCSGLIDCSDAVNHGGMNRRWFYQKSEHDERISMQCIDHPVRRPLRMEDSQWATDRWARHNYRGTRTIYSPKHLQRAHIIWGFGNLTDSVLAAMAQVFVPPAAI